MKREKPLKKGFNFFLHTGSMCQRQVAAVKTIDYVRKHFEKKQTRVQTF